MFGLLDRKDVVIGILFATTMASSIAGTLVVKKFEELENKYRKVHAAGSYLASMLEEHDIELSEFDLIAFKELGLLGQPDKE